MKRISRKLTTPNAVQGAQQQELSFIVGGKLQLVQVIWKTFLQFLERPNTLILTECTSVYPNVLKLISI